MPDLIDPQFRVLMNTLANVLDETFNGTNYKTERKVGFTLLAFNFGDNTRVNYISNAKRDDMLATMKSFIARAEGRFVDEKGTG